MVEIPDIYREDLYSDDVASELFPDDDHPLHSPYEDRQEWVAERLRFAYEHAKGNGAVSSQRDWAIAVRGEDDATRRLAQGWLAHPERMTADDVEATCDLFGCTVAFLRGLDYATDSRTGEQRVQGAYARLHERQREIMAELVYTLSGLNADISERDQHMAEMRGEIAFIQDESEHHMAELRDTIAALEERNARLADDNSRLKEENDCLREQLRSVCGD